MEVLFNKYYSILVDSLILFIFFSLSCHPLLVKEVSYFALLIQYLAKFLLIFMESFTLSAGAITEVSIPGLIANSP